MAILKGLRGITEGMNDGVYAGGVKRYYSSWGVDMEELEVDGVMSAMDRFALGRDGELEYFGVQMSMSAARFDRGRYRLEDMIGDIKAPVWQCDIFVFSDYESWKAFDEGRVVIWRTKEGLIVRSKEEVVKMSINN